MKFKIKFNTVYTCVLFLISLVIGHLLVDYGEDGRELLAFYFSVETDLARNTGSSSISKLYSFIVTIFFLNRLCSIISISKLKNLHKRDHIFLLFGTVFGVILIGSFVSESLLQIKMLNLLESLLALFLGSSLLLLDLLMKYRAKNRDLSKHQRFR